MAPPEPPQRPKQKAAAEYALVISIDGLGWQTFEAHKTASPILSGLAKKGVACPMEVVFPSVTWASHASLVTGQYPRKHGIVGNRWLEEYDHLIHPFESEPVDPERSKRTPSLYDLAHDKGWITAAINWPATQGATKLTYNWPEVMQQGDIAYRLLSPDLRQVVRDLYQTSHAALPRGLQTALRPSDGHLETLFNRLSISEVNDTDMLVADLTSELIAPQKTQPRPHPLPRLMLTHFLTMDSWFHKYGPTPQIADWALRHIDLYLRQVVDAYKRAGIWDKTVVLITSDHGFHPIRKAMDLRVLWADHRLTSSTQMGGLANRQKAKILTFYNGHAAYVYVRPKDQPSLLPKMLSLLRKPQYKSCVQDIFFPAEYQKLGLPTPPDWMPSASALSSNPTSSVNPLPPPSPSRQPPSQRSPSDPPSGESEERLNLDGEEATGEGQGIDDKEGADLGLKTPPKPSPSTGRRNASTLSRRSSEPSRLERGQERQPFLSAGERQPLWSHRGAPTLIVLSKPDCTFRPGHRRREVIQPIHRTQKDAFVGNHGYLPNHPSMKALFLASGAGIRSEASCSARIKQTRTVDVAPTLAYLLGLSWPSHWGDLPKRPLLLDGKVLKPLLQP